MTKIGENLSFKPKDATKKMLAVLAPRAREVVAKRYTISREAQDRYSLSSQQRTARAQESGFFKEA